MIKKIKRFFELLFVRIRGPQFRTGDIIPYYGGKTTIYLVHFDKRWGWMYKFVDAPEHSFSEGLVQFYIDNPNKDGRSYGSRNKG